LYCAAGVANILIFFASKSYLFYESIESSLAYYSRLFDGEKLDPASLYVSGESGLAL